MSLSNPRGTTSPVQRHFELKLAVGSVGYYDRDTKKNVNVTDPAGEWEEDKKFAATPAFKVIVLDVLSFIGGFNNKQKSGVWSNEIRSTKDEELVVRTRDGVLARGLYDEIKGDLAKLGGKFGNSVYLAYQEDGEWKLGNLKMTGAGLSAFFDFKKGKFFDSDPGLAIVGWTGMKTGTNEYFSPAFKSWEVGPDDLDAALELDKQLQEYLGSKKSDEPQRESAPVVDEFEDSPPF